MGSRLAARFAGQIPKNRPTAALNTNASRMANGEISVFQCASLDSTTAPIVPNTTPIIPPTRHSTSASTRNWNRSEEHTSELQSLAYLVCRLLLEKKKHRLKLPVSARIAIATYKLAL